MSEREGEDEFAIDTRYISPPIVVSHTERTTPWAMPCPARETQPGACTVRANLEREVPAGKRSNSTPCWTYDARIIRGALGRSFDVGYGTRSLDCIAGGACLDGHRWERSPGVIRALLAIAADERHCRTRAWRRARWHRTSSPCSGSLVHAERVVSEVLLGIQRLSEIGARLPRGENPEARGAGTR